MGRIDPMVLARLAHPHLIENNYQGTLLLTWIKLNLNMNK